MAALLQVPNQESCYNALRVRRRSSIRPRDLIPRFFSGERSEGSAVADDVADLPDAAACITPISLPSDAYLPQNSPCNSSPFIDPSPTPPLKLASGETSAQSIKSSLEEDGSNFPRFEHMNKRLFSAFFAYFLCGWADGITGAILPYFREEFHLTYMTSSLIFVTSTLGFAFGTVFIELVMRVMGRFYLASTGPSYFPAVPIISQLFRPRGTHNPTAYSAHQARQFTLIMSSTFHIAYFVLMSSRRNYTLVLVAYCVAALGRSFLTAILNAYVASTPKQLLGHLLAFWSLGAFASPLVCQTLIGIGVPWPHFYSGSLLVAAMNTLFLALTFRSTQREYDHDRQVALDLVNALAGRDGYVVESKSELSSPIGDELPSAIVADAPPPRKSLLRVCTIPYQWAIAIFGWIQSGSETTVQGFIVSYLLVMRNANPNTAGYVTSGFWAGQAISRFIWGYYTPHSNFTQRKYIVQLCIGIMVVMQILIWFVNSNIENAFSTGVIGLLSGPLFPATLRMANDVLPTEVHLVSMAMISSFASFGSALFPFITGVVSSVKGPEILAYVMVAQGAILFCLWGLLPSRRPSHHSD